MNLTERVNETVTDITEEHTALTAKLVEFNSTLSDNLLVLEDLNGSDATIPDIKDKLRQIKQGQSNTDVRSSGDNLFSSINDLIERRRNYQPLLNLFEAIKDGKLGLLEFTATKKDNTFDIQSTEIGFSVNEENTKAKLIFEKLFGNYNSTMITVYSNRITPNKHTFNNYSYLRFQAAYAKELSEELRYKLQPSAQGIDLQEAVTSFQNVDIESVTEKRALLNSISEEEFSAVKTKLIQDYFLIKEYINI